MVEFDEKIVATGYLRKTGVRKLKAGWMGLDDGQDTLAESITNLTEGIFLSIASEMPGSSHTKNYCGCIPDVINIWFAICDNNFPSLATRDCRPSKPVEGVFRISCDSVAPFGVKRQVDGPGRCMAVASTWLGARKRGS